MRLHHLELTGFGPFRHRQTVDFEAFERDGIFLIAGRTGAGKSSILDGVCFALYGSVPRYESGDKRLRSDHCEPDDPTEVRLEFTVGDRRWRVTRAPEYLRPARRGGGLTSEPTRAELEELVDGVWIGRAARPRDVGLLLDEVLGLNAQQFQQVILLAQNRFSRFLLASGAERQSLLRALFGTRKYEEYARELGERSKAAQRELDALGERALTLIGQAERLIDANDLGTPDAGTPGDGATDAAADPGAPGATADDGAPGASDAGDLVAPGAAVQPHLGAAGAPGASAPGAPEPATATGLGSRRAAVDRSQQRAGYRLDTLHHRRAEADAARTAAEAAHAERVALAKSLAELERARTGLSALEAAAAGVGADRAVLDDARAAEALRAPLEVARRAAAVAAAADEATTAADGDWRRAALAADVDPAGQLGALLEQLTGDLALWTAALPQEAALPQHEARLREASLEVVRLEADVLALDAQRAAVPAELARLDRELAAARDGAALLDPVRGRRTEIVQRLGAAEEAERLADERRTAETAHRDAATTAADSAAHVAALLQRRLDGYAGELASRLVEGEPCAVCGATDHPQPAPLSDEPVTDDLLEHAEGARDAASAAERVAADAARAARELLADATARAGGEAADVLRARLATAADELATAEQAVARRDALAAQRAQLAELDAEAETSRAVLVDALADARTRVAATTATVEATRALVHDARGPYPSVAERVDGATALRDAARAAAAARTAAARAAEAHANARDDARARVEASVFADADAATAALRDAAVVAALAARISEHDAQLAATRARVLELELELAGAADTPVDIAASQHALAAADRTRTAALEAEHGARVVVQALRDLALQIDDAYAGLAARADEAATVTRLADTVAGRAPNTMKMDLETFVLAAELEEIVSAANVRLGDMSSGRYRLQHTDARAARGAASGLGLEIMDAFTGQARPAQSLSGGETFLASLALALGLAEVVTARAGGVRLDTLFVDEGFGSLDEETLDLAMRTLDELRQGGRTVGVISHVAAMKEQVPAQLAVEATAEGASVIRQDAAVPA